MVAALDLKHARERELMRCFPCISDTCRVLASVVRTLATASPREVLPLCSTNGLFPATMIATDGIVFRPSRLTRSRGAAGPTQGRTLLGAPRWHQANSVSPTAFVLRALRDDRSVRDPYVVLGVPRGVRGAAAGLPRETYPARTRAGRRHVDDPALAGISSGNSHGVSRHDEATAPGREKRRHNCRCGGGASARPLRCVAMRGNVIVVAV